jgi:hypothetical protein
MKTRMNSAIVALGLAGATFAMSAPAQAQDVGVGVHVGGIGVGVGIGDVAFGYRDGYWDHGHRWHHWREGELGAYRNGPNSQYSDWNHDRDRDLGWRGNAGGPTIVFDVNEVAFGYRDGYWDHGHRWHDWRAGEMSTYRNGPGNRFNDWNHDRDPDHGWHS